MGRRANDACSSARELVAELVGCQSNEVFFTSGATESNNLVLLGVMGFEHKRKKIVISQVEHKSIIEPCQALVEFGIEVVQIPVNHDCIVDLDAAADAIDENTALVSVHGANNEVGVLQPVRKLAEIAHSKGALFHCDGAQLLGKVPVSSENLGFDYASFSGHKLYGPKGIGVLFVRKGAAMNSIRPIFRGGGQEGALRPGTLNVPGIVGIGEACRLARERLSEDVKRIATLRRRFEFATTQVLPIARFNSSEVDRLPGTTSLTIPGLLGSILVVNVPHLCISEGSACNSGALQPSHVLLAMGIPYEDAECTVRISFGRSNSISDVDEAVLAIEREAKRLLSAMYSTVMSD